MNKTEKENRINSLAVAFLEKQQIQPNIFADQIIRGYKEGYHQAEKDLELSLEDISAIRHTMARLRRQISNDNQVVNNEEFCKEVLKRFKERKGEDV